MPEKLVLPSLPEGTKLEATHEALIKMIDGAKSTIRIASFYLELTPQETKLASDDSVRAEFEASKEAGFKVREALAKAGSRGVDVEIIVDHSNKKSITNEADVKYLHGIPNIKVKEISFRKVGVKGILHTKLMIVDGSSFYIGSANFDWRSYTQVKEIGLVGRGCPNMADDLAKIYNTYALLVGRDNMPDLGLSQEFQTEFNIYTPIVSNNMNMFFTASPAPLNGLSHQTGRTNDIDALLRIIWNAERQIDISVMNYSPQYEFSWPKIYWPQIDDALREAAVRRGVQIRLMFSKWDNSKPIELVWYRSLNALQSKHLNGGGIHVKLFQVPKIGTFQEQLPFARVKHDKYMVTDNGLYLGTNNWTPDYFNNTAGISAVMTPHGETPGPIIETMKHVFERDFNSEFAHELDEFPFEQSFHSIAYNRPIK